jgi:RNA polymerase sigma-70 factor (ECF subfamily)
MDDFQWQGITVSAWIFRIARNHIIDYYRKENKHKGDKSLDDVAHFIESQSPTVDAELEHKESEKSLYLAMQQLKEDEQYMIYYKFYEDLPNKDVAQILGMSETNVGTKLHRLKKKLEEIIHKQENNVNSSK